MKYKNATVRIHGTIDQEKLKKATETFLKKMQTERRKRNGSNDNALYKEG